MSESVTVWDDDGIPVDATGAVLYWRSYAEDTSGISVPRYLEEHADRLRAKYIGFIHDLGEHRIAGKRVVEHLALADGFSFWWMTQLSEKSPFKSPRLFGCLRLLALEEILLEKKPRQLVLNSPDRDLGLAIRNMCRSLHIGFSWRSTGTHREKWSLRRLYLSLPYAIQGLLSLRHLVPRWPLRNLEKPSWFSGDGSIFLCSYFFNLDPASAAAGGFQPRQLEGLPQHLRDHRLRANWIHHFLRSPAIPDVGTGLKWMRLFNRDADKQGHHAFLETFLSWRVLRRVLRNWLWLNLASWRLHQARAAFRPKNSAVWLWPLLRHDWQASLNGAVAVNNCLWVELFDAALALMPLQKTGLYIWENQGWECALLRAWRRNGHGKITGVPHATVVFWHLNNFDDPRVLIADQNCHKPLPDCLAVNGPMAWRAFAETGYPVERLVEVEALRFQYLIAPHANKSGQRQGNAVATNCQTLKVLILGDFTLVQTLKMLGCIEAASHLMNTKLSFTLKPHPVCTIEAGDFPQLRFQLTDKPLAELTPNFNVAFCSNTSSAALDALLAGLPVVVFLDDGDFNHSPLRGVDGIQFSITARELAGALQVVTRSAHPPDAGDFFWLDKELPRWRKLLSEARDD